MNNAHSIKRKKIGIPVILSFIIIILIYQLYQAQEQVRIQTNALTEVITQELSTIRSDFESIHSLSSEYAEKDLLSRNEISTMLESYQSIRYHLTKIESLNNLLSEPENYEDHQGYIYEPYYIQKEFLSHLLESKEESITLSEDDQLRFQEMIQSSRIYYNALNTMLRRELSLEEYLQTTFRLFHSTESD